MQNNPAAYFASLVLLPTVIDGPGCYVTRCGDAVTVETVAPGPAYRYNCVGRYDACGTRERWHRSGRIFSGRETPNDVVSKARRVVVMNGSRLEERHNGRGWVTVAVRPAGDQAPGVYPQENAA